MQVGTVRLHWQPPPFLLSSLPGRLEHGAATGPWLLRESPGPPDQARPPVNQGPVCPTVARVTRRAHPSSGRAGSANPATLNRPAPQQSPTLASESVNLSPRLKGRYTTHCLEAQSCAALLDPGFFASRIFSISTTFSPSPLPPSLLHLETITLVGSIDIPLLLAPTYFRPQFGEDFIRDLSTGCSLL